MVINNITVEPTTYLPDPVEQTGGVVGFTIPAFRAYTAIFDTATCL